MTLTHRAGCMLCCAMHDVLPWLMCMRSYARAFALEGRDGGGAALRRVPECVARCGGGVRQRVDIVLHRKGDTPESAALARGLRLQLSANWLCDQTSAKRAVQLAKHWRAAEPAAGGGGRSAGQQGTIAAPSQRSVYRA